ncbi:MAG: hypothetical protein Q9191_005055, partial [Dirinaria sp. TL-2023a]
MNGSRDERLLMRQRGAGTRQIKSSGFDLILPGQSKTPLKPRKSGKVGKTPLAKLAPLKSSRRTPKSKSTNNASKPKKAPVLPSSKPADIDDEDDMLASNAGGIAGVESTTKKRKFAGDGIIGKGTKKPRLARDNGREETGTIKGGRATQHKPETGAYNSKAPVDAGPTENSIEKELSVSVPEITVSCVTKEEFSKGQVNEEAIGAEESQENGQSRTDDDHRPGQRKRVTKPKAPRDPKAPKQMNHVPAISKETTEASAGAAPTKKRKKRRSIGQQSMKAKKRRSSESTKDLLPKMEISNSPPAGPEPPGLHAGIPQNRLGNSTPPVGIETASPQVDFNQATPNVALGASEYPPHVRVTQEKKILRTEPQTKAKPRKKRKPIAQVRRPKKPLRKDSTDAVPQTHAVTDKHKQVPSTLASISVTQPKGRPRKPLANVTNVTKDVKAKSSNPNSKEDAASRMIEPNCKTLKITQPPAPPENPSTGLSETRDKPVIGTPQDRHDESHPNAPPKPRGRPRKQPQTAPPPSSNKKPLPKPQAPSKPPKRATKPSKPAPPASVPITVYRPDPPTTNDSDSDDPLSLSAHYPPKKKVPNAIDVLAQVSQEILEKQMKKEGVSPEEQGFME